MGNKKIEIRNQRSKNRAQQFKLGVPKRDSGLGARGFLDVDFDFYGVHPEAGVGVVEELDVQDGNGKFKGSGDGLARQAGLHFSGGKVDGAFYAREGGLPSFADAADENVEPFCRRTLTVGDSTTEAVEIDVACGGALRGADRGGFTGAAKIADRFIIVALSRARNSNVLFCSSRTDGDTVRGARPAEAEVEAVRAAASVMNRTSREDQKKRMAPPARCADSGLRASPIFHRAGSMGDE